MSHIRKIKTSISNLSVLEKTLRELGIQYEHKSTTLSLYGGQQIQVDIPFMMKEQVNRTSDSFSMYRFGFQKDKDNYVLVGDDFGTNQKMDSILLKVSQTYSKNIVLTTMEEHPELSLVGEFKLQNGDIKLVIENLEA